MRRLRQSTNPSCGRPLPRELTAPFAPKGQVTETWLSVLNFGQEGWLWPDKLNLIKNVLAEQTSPLPSTSLSRVF
ncbi:hypothetical protein PCANC_19431 [Puccinia coronata f. sp. avenae]|uniref:Uncharacterized protein n=1 Tax=Puccinia coronata f. sp. avenae TaxID=200324 RepID=A0A2N5V143_9BASI|nr:hypothetical protein PCANC_19431 [Puccinia coronata f. sp. avenae]